MLGYWEDILEYLHLENILNSYIWRKENVFILPKEVTLSTLVIAHTSVCM